MPRALQLVTASKANITGGAFADPLVANAGDSLTIANFERGGARILEWWAIDSDAIAEIELFSSRLHDAVHGVRLAIPALVPGGAGTVAARQLLPGPLTVPVYSGDVLSVTASGTAADDVVSSFLIEYDDLDGVNPTYLDWPSVQSRMISLVGIQVTAVASATPGAYGADRAFNADDDRLHADRSYAVLGWTTQTQVTTISLRGIDTGNQRIGGPAGATDNNAGVFFVDMSQKYQRACIPVIKANNKGSILVNVADGEASTSPHIDFVLAELG